MNNCKILVFLILSFSILTCLSCKSQAGLFNEPIPKGKEIKDPYLEQLFAPEFPYESIKVIDTEEDKRYVIVKAKQSIIREMEREYENKTLFNRKVTIYRAGSPRTGTLLVAEMRLHRIVSEKPFVVEYSKVESVKAEKVLAGRAEDVVRSSGKYLVIRINKDFGKVFKKVVIYPEKEVKCPEPPFVEKYPNSISIACTEKNKWIVFVYVSKDKAEDIYKFYSGGLKKHFKNVGFHFPEDSWEFSREFGIQIESIEVDQWGNYLDRKRKDKPIKSPLPLNGVVFHIVIDKGSPKSFIQDFSFIKIYYSINPDVIKKNIEDHRKLYPPVEE